MKKKIKRCMAAFLTFALILTGLSFTSADQVLATEAEEISTADDLLSAFKDGADHEIKLTGDIILSQKAESDSGNIAIDLNGYTLKHNLGPDLDVIVISGGKLRFSDSIGGGKISMGSNSIRLDAAGCLELAAGAVCETLTGPAVSSDAGGSFLLEEGAVIRSGDGAAADLSGASLKITGGGIEGNIALKLKDCTTDISGGSFQAKAGTIAAADGNLVISGGTIVQDSSFEAYLLDTVNTDVLVTGGDFQAKRNLASFSGGQISLSETVSFYSETGNIITYKGAEGSELNIDGGSYQSETGTILVADGDVFVQEGIFDSRQSSVLDVKGEIRIQGGEFNGNAEAYGTVILRENASVQIIGGKFHCGRGDLFTVENKASLNIMEGEFTADQQGILNMIDEAAAVITGGKFWSFAEEQTDAEAMFAANHSSNFTIGGGEFSSKYLPVLKDYNAVGGTNGIPAGVSFSCESGNAVIQPKTTGTVSDLHEIFSNGVYPKDNRVTVDDTSVYSAGTVETVNGSLVTFQSGRSELEMYASDESELEMQAENDCTPITVEAGGIVHADGFLSSQIDMERAVDKTASYELSYWGDREGNKLEFSDLSSVTADTELYGYWRAGVGSASSFEVLPSFKSIAEIELESDIALTKCTPFLYLKSLDFKGHTVAAPVISNGVFHVKGSNVTLKDSTGGGGIQSSGICVYAGTDVSDDVLNIESGTYENTTGSPAVYYGTGSSGKISGGTFLSGRYDGYGLCVYQRTGTFADIEEHLDLGGGRTYSNASYLVQSGFVCSSRKFSVVEAPLLYRLAAEQPDLGSAVYGYETAIKASAAVKNTGTGDVTVTKVALDPSGASCFELAYTVSGQELAAGESADLADIKIKAGQLPGVYAGNLMITYTRQDGSTDTASLPISFTVHKKQLQIEAPEVIMEKVYDGTNRADVIPGKIVNALSGDDISVTAEAVYNSPDAGAFKTITVTYQVTGESAALYKAPDTQYLFGGAIKRAEGSASVSIEDWYVGGRSKAPKPVSQSNGTGYVEYSYKRQGEADAAYTDAIPQEEGSYTLRAVFLATTNYEAVTATADFEISYLDTPEDPCQISGRKGKNGYYSSAVTITPKKGYTIGLTETGSFGRSLKIDQTGTVTVYLKNGDGCLTRAVKAGEFKIDTTAPAFTGEGMGITIGDFNWKTRITDIVYQIFLKDAQSVVIRANDPESGIDKYEYLVSEKELSLNELKKSKDFKDGNSLVISARSLKESVVYARVTNKAGLTSYLSSDGLVLEEGMIGISGSRSLRAGGNYLLGDGSWQLKGDTTVYKGGREIYVKKDGIYEFRKQ